MGAAVPFHLHLKPLKITWKRSHLIQMVAVFENEMFTKSMALQILKK